MANLRSKLMMASLASVLVLHGCGGREGGPAPVSHYGTTGTVGAGVVSVLPGENLWQLSKRYDMPMRDIIEVNNLSAPFDLDVGQRLKLPIPRRYTVEAGDTLYGVSRLYSVSVTDLVRANNLHAPYKIQAGDDLILPVSYHRHVAEHQQSYSQAETPQQKILYPPRKPSQKTTTHTEKMPTQKGFVWPVTGAIISAYGPKKNGQHNDGINIQTSRGQKIRTVDAGRVVYVGDELESYGNLILVRHQNGFISAYGHLQNVMVKVGQNIASGTYIGEAGSTGYVDTPQLHLEIRKGAEALNPLKFLPRL